MEITVILLNNADSDFITNRNKTNFDKAIICDYGQGNCILESVLDMPGCVDIKNYFNGVYNSVIITISDKP